jgi:hypothetical protein
LNDEAVRPKSGWGLAGGLKKMRNHILVPGFVALGLIVANTWSVTAKPVNELAGVNNAKSARHIEYPLVRTYSDNTHGQKQRIVIAKEDDR